MKSYHFLRILNFLCVYYCIDADIVDSEQIKAALKKGLSLNSKLVLPPIKSDHQKFHDSQSLWCVCLIFLCSFQFLTQCIVLVFGA